MFSIKKTALALATVLCAAGAQAADIQIRGALDAGVTVVRSHGDTSVQMSPDNYVGSEIGLFGEEHLTDNATLGFALRSRFNVDTGAMQTEGHLFDYESQVYVKGDFGQFGAGRMSPFASSVGSQGWMMPFDAFEAGFWNAGLQSTQQTTWATFNNSLYYVTPVMNGFKAGLFYSLSGYADKEETHQSRNERYWNAALHYENGPLKALLSAEGTLRSSQSDMKDGTGIRAAIRYDFPMLKLMGGYAHADHQDSYAFGTFDENAALPAVMKSGISSDQAWVGVRVPVDRFEYLAQYQYLDGKVKDTDQDFKRHVFAIGAFYYMSDRTILYTDLSKSVGRGTMSSKVEGTAANDLAFQFGVTHFF